LRDVRPVYCGEETWSENKSEGNAVAEKTERNSKEEKSSESRGEEYQGRPARKIEEGDTSQRRETMKKKDG